MTAPNPLPDRSDGEGKYALRMRILFSVALAVCLVAAGLVVLPRLRPSLSRDIVYAHRKSCIAHLQTIGNALRIYADAHAGQYPDSLETLILSGAAVRGSDFQCPSCADLIPDAATPQLLARQISSLGVPDGFADLHAYKGPIPSRYLSYVYVAPDLKEITTRSVVLFEPITNHDDRIHVLFGDGSVESIEKPHAIKFLLELEAGHNPPRAERLTGAAPATSRVSS